MLFRSGAIGLAKGNTIYLLAGTGSNIYARQLTREWSRQGHDVTVFSQESDPSRFDLGGATAVTPDALHEDLSQYRDVLLSLA